MCNWTPPAPTLPGRRPHTMSLRSAQFLLFYGYFAFGSLLQVFPPLLISLQREFGVGHRDASLVISLFLAPMVLLALPSGMAADRFGVVPVARVGLGGMLAGTVVTLLAPSWPGVVGGRLVAGAGGALLLVALLKICTERVPREKLGLTLGIFAAGLPVGTGLAFNGLRQLGATAGWRVALAGAGIVLVSAAAVVELIGSRRSTEVACSVNPALALRSTELWRLSLVTAFGYAAIIGFTTWAPTTLVNYARIPAWAAAFIASMLLVIDIPFAPLWGAVSDRVGRRKPFVVTAFAIYLAGSIAVPWIAPTHNVFALVGVIAVMGIGCAMFFPAALTIPAEAVPPDRTGSAYGLFFTAQVTGMLVGPLLIGQILDSATPTWAFLSVSGLTAGGLAAAFSLRSR